MTNLMKTLQAAGVILTFIFFGFVYQTTTVGAQSVPVIDSINPSSINIYGNIAMPVAIYGSNFNPSKYPIVLLDGSSVITLSSVTDSSATFFANLIKAGTHTIQIGYGGVFSNKILLNITEGQKMTSTPVIVAVSPKSAAAGSTLTISGSNFTKESIVTLDTRGDIFVSTKYIDVDTISFTVPQNTSVGTHTIKVKEKAGNAVASNSFPINVTAFVPTPTINSINPTIVVIGTKAVITGSNFYKKSFVEIKGKGFEAQMPAVSQTNIQMSFFVPFTVVPGIYTIRIGGRESEYSNNSLAFSNSVLIKVTDTLSQTTVNTVDSNTQASPKIEVTDIKTVSNQQRGSNQVSQEPSTPANVIDENILNTANTEEAVPRRSFMVNIVNNFFGWISGIFK